MSLSKISVLLLALCFGSLLQSAAATEPHFRSFHVHDAWNTHAPIVEYVTTPAIYSQTTFEYSLNSVYPMTWSPSPTRYRQQRQYATPGREYQFNRAEARTTGGYVRLFGI